jgi:hypothetical protein
MVAATGLVAWCGVGVSCGIGGAVLAPVLAWVLARRSAGGTAGSTVANGMPRRSAGFGRALGAAMFGPTPWAPVPARAVAGVPNRLVVVVAGAYRLRRAAQVAPAPLEARSRQRRVQGRAA